LQYNSTHRAFIAGVVLYEATLPTPLAVLTCSTCGRRKNHALYGFCDDHFDQKLLNRDCVECRYPRWYLPRLYVDPNIMVNRVAIDRCVWCTHLHVLPRRETRNRRGVGVHTCDSGQDHEWVDRASKEFDVPKMEGRVGKRWFSMARSTGIH